MFVIWVNKNLLLKSYENTGSRLDGNKQSQQFASLYVSYIEK